LESQNAIVSQQLLGAQEELRDAHETIKEQSSTIKRNIQCINRLVRDKSVLAAKAACLKQEVLRGVLRAEAAEKISASQGLCIEHHLQSILRLEAMVDSNREKQRELKKTLRATEMREDRAKTALENARKPIRDRPKWTGMKGCIYSSQYHSLALAFTRAGCAQARFGPLLSRVAKVFKIDIKRCMHRRTIGRDITEAGIKVRLQLGHEMARAKGGDIFPTLLYFFFFDIVGF
jgi:hypothetical protein